MKRFPITSVQVGDRVSLRRSGFLVVAAVEISYTSAAADSVTVRFVDSRSRWEDWNSYPADTLVWIKEG